MVKIEKSGGAILVRRNGASLLYEKKDDDHIFDHIRKANIFKEINFNWKKILIIFMEYSVIEKIKTNRINRKKIKKIYYKCL